MREDGTFTTRHPSTSSSLSSHSASPLFPHLSSLPLDLHSFAVDRRRQDLLACAAACADLEKLDTFSVSSHSHQRDERKVGGSTTSNLSHTSSLIEHTGKSDLHPSPSPPLPSPNTVYLHVYDLDPTISKYVNKVMRPLGAGAFHAGVEVYGIEYCYGQTCDDSSGITINRPRKHPVHIYRETIVMGATPFAHEEFLALIEALKDEWPGVRYNILTRNCLNFANQLCLLLGVGSLPSWLLRLQQQASHLQKTVQQAARRLQEFDETTGISAVATAAATAAMAAARVFGGLLIQPSQPSLMTGGGEATSVGSRIDRAFTSGMSFLSGGLGAFADGVAEGLAGILDDPQEEEEEVASSPYPEGREREGGVEVTEEEQEEERRKEEERKEEEEDHARFHQHDDSHLRSERQEALLSSSPFSPSPSDFSSSSSSSSDPFIEDLSKRHFKEEGEEQKEVLDNLKIHEGLR